MPGTRLIMGGHGGKGASRVRITAKGGNVMHLPVAPRGFTADGGANIVQLDRQGLEALTRVDGPKKRTLSFSIDLGRIDWRRDIQPQVEWLERRRNEGRQIKFSNMPAEFAGWWLIESMPVNVTQMTPGHKISRATLDFSLVAFLDYTGKVQRTPPPKAKVPKGRSTTSGTTRHHTVASGETLSKISARYYGNASHWRRLAEANRNIIKNPDIIRPGQRLRIPPR